MLWQSIKNWFKDLIFPFFCLECGQEGWPLCPGCQKNIPLLSWQVCPVCEKTITEKGEVCSNCSCANYPLDHLLVASDYQQNKIAKSIHLLKYNFIQELAPFLGKIICKAIQKNNLPLPDIILPVPLHPSRLRWRGFNQAELLAKFVSQNLVPFLEIPIKTDWLLREKKTLPQMKIKDAQERKINLEGAFKINFIAQEQGKNKRILIIDDVCTTGATLSECAKTLRRIHPKSLSAVVIGRQK